MTEDALGQHIYDTMFTPGGTAAFEGPWYRDDAVTVYQGDCLDVLKLLAPNSVDAVVTDPPYGLEFMGKEWDQFKPSDAKIRTRTRDIKGRSVISASPDAYRAGMPFQNWCEQWAAECLRVLKPGGHMLAFGGTRTSHRLAAGIEDAGFEIRDTIGYGSGVVAWCYGSGFPKSRNISRDPSACQCLPGMRDTATEYAAQSATQILLSDLRGSGEAELANIENLQGVRVDLHPDYALPIGAKQDLLEGVRCGGNESGEARTAVIKRPAGDGSVRDMREDSQEITESDQENDGDLLLDQMPRESSCGRVDSQQVRCDRDEAGAAVRAGKPGMEGWRDVQASEGQLHQPALRAVSTGTDGNVPIGRLHHGTPSGDGEVDRPDIAAGGVREPHQPDHAGQPAGEPGTVPEQRRPQARRGWPICRRCGKPALPEGLGTALKPSWEPVVVARKPIQGTVAACVLAHGTGALNIDACRVEANDLEALQKNWDRTQSEYQGIASTGLAAVDLSDRKPAGRWPANVVLDEHTAAELDKQSGNLKSGSRRAGIPRATRGYDGGWNDDMKESIGDSGGASRFFPVFKYTAKAPGTERPTADGICHPTVKPLGLMRWLIRLVTPPHGVVLDPFAGTGTTGEAAIHEHMYAILIEREPTYLPLIVARLSKPMAVGFDFEEGA